MRRAVATAFRSRSVARCAVACAAVAALWFASPAAAGGTQVQVQFVGVTTPQGGLSVDDSLSFLSPEFAFDEEDSDGLGGDGQSAGGVVDRSLVVDPGTVAPVSSGRKAKSNPELNLSFAGVNFHDQRFANGGNQFSVEPPDQALCAGDGFVVESVNDVLRIYRSSGVAVTGPVDLNTFYGYSAAIDRSTGRVGPSITDPSCYFDAPSQRWFHVALTLDRVAFTTALSGTNHLDIAVSQTADPTGAWNLYRVPVQNDGTEGTPDHGCVIRVSRNPDTFVHGPCLGDYPHVGADANGFYITTNEFDLAAPGRFHAAQIYALSKLQLASGSPTVNGVLFDTTNLVGYPSGALPGFTVWPATTPGTEGYDASAGGTEYLLSSDAVFSPTGTSSDLVAWSITNTASLGTATPSPVLHSSFVPVLPYSVPGRSSQKPGNLPLRDCLADPTCAQPIAGAAAPSTANVEERPTSNDSRMQQVVYANGKLWVAIDTGLLVNGAAQAGLAWFVLRPNASASTVKASVVRQGYLGLAGNNLTYPAVGVTPSGRGVIGFTLLGADYYPSAGYASVDALVGAGDVHVAAAGAGPDDGFSGYIPFAANQNRPRWGDYGAAATDGNSIWLASEYIDQTCTYAEYRFVAPVGTCGGTRGVLGNWSTRVTKVTP